MEEVKHLLGTLAALRFFATFFGLFVLHTSIGESNTGTGLHIAQSTSAMAKTSCPADAKWDSLVNKCIQSVPAPEPKSDPPTEPAVSMQLRATSSAAQADSVVVLSLSLWILVVLAILGSVLALAVWIIIYRRPTRHSNTIEDAGLQQEALQKTEPPVKIYPLLPERNSHAERAPSACPHVHPGGQTGSKWEEDFIAYRDSAKHVGTGGGGGVPACSMMREHRIPLPATELGGTALVTTKTV